MFVNKRFCFRLSSVFLELSNNNNKGNNASPRTVFSRLNTGAVYLKLDLVGWRLLSEGVSIFIIFDSVNFCVLYHCN